ncbi:unnamed protein product [Callosobruchus maculatus]|uniref:Uncharacterized protein n=1 Tax=Callosobruchus maculatus TaxID=64391 RepID=A0A653CFN1_CALMS|nr:unnamed protein product [Callosobruchus maculatus]
MASPLLDLESCEEQLLKKPGYNFQSPREPRYEFTQNQNVNPPKSAKNSPISAMCNLLQNAGISSTKKLPRLNNIPSSALKEIIEMENTEYEKLESTQTEELTELKRMIEVHLQLVESLMDIKHKKETNLCELRKKHQEKLEWLTKLSENNNSEENCDSVADKENNPRLVRRSMRLQSKSPVPVRNSKPAVSPVIPDLRKSTLKKNMAARYQSPRTSKAMDMYNSFKELHKNVLETPRIDRSMSETGSPNSSFKKNFSRKVLDQCMMLQDTPKH